MILSLKGHGRKHSLPNEATIMAYAWGNQETSKKTSLIIAGVPAEIQTKHLPHANLEEH
jgi:hypothetical protein